MAGDANTFTESTDDTPAVAAATRIAGRYEILGLLGAGGMGTVYRVRDTTLDEIVALKLLRGHAIASTGALDRMRQEVKLARRVTHPNVVRTFDLGEHDGTWFLTMEFVDARPLSWRLDAGAMPLDEAVRVMVAACEGVAAAHAAGVLHRDLKPDNILVGEPTAAGQPGRVAITDFGIASQRGEATGGLSGTPAYMAPEQVEGRDIDGRVDIYALGAVLYELVTGQKAWSGPDPLAIARARLVAPPPDPRLVAPVTDGVADVVLRCMARDPRYRFANANELRDSLLGVHRIRAVSARSEEIPLPASRSSTLAVVPFRCSPEDTWLANGLAEELIDALSVARGLRVRPFAAVQRLRGETDAEAIGRALDVDAVLTGSLRRSGDVVVVTARLISVADGFQVWGTRATRPESALLVESETIAMGAAAALQEHVIASRTTATQDVVEPYLRARHEYRLGYETGRLDEAQRHAEVGLAIAPRDPGLLSVFALISARQAFYSADADDARLARGFAAAQLAIAVAPHSAEAWLAMGALHFVAHGTPEAARALIRAVREAPSLARAQDMLGGILLDVGRVTDARARLAAALALDPIPLFVRLDLARAHAYLGEWDAVDALTRDDPDPTARVIVGIYRNRFSLWSNGRIAPVHVTEEQVLAGLPPTNSAVSLSNLLVAATHGTLDDARDEIAATRVLDGHRRLRSSCSQMVAEARAATGRLDGALQSIAVAVDAGLYDLQWMDACPALATVRADPRFGPLREVVAGRAADVVAALS